MRKLQLSRGYNALVDDDVYEKFQFVNWHVQITKFGKPYATSNKLGLLHRAIFIYIDGIDIEGVEIDHKNRNGLDNRRENLRFATKAENARNNSRRPNSTSSVYTGVSWRKHAKRWSAKIAYAGKSIHLGYYDTEEEAGMAYDRAALYYYGDTEFLNFPESKGKHDISSPCEIKYKTIKSTNSSGYRGVSSKGKKFSASIGIGGRPSRKIHIGTYETAELAALAYDKYVIENNLDRPLNFPP